MLALTILREQGRGKCWGKVGNGFVGLTENKLIYEELSIVDMVENRISPEKRGYQQLFSTGWAVSCSDHLHLI